MRICHIAIAACLTLLSLPALADTTYTYTGKDFFSDGILGPYTTSDSVTGSFTVASPLPDNDPFPDVKFLSFSFTDGVQTITNLNSYSPEIRIATDSSGNITDWYVYLFSIDNHNNFIETEAFVDQFHDVNIEDKGNDPIPGVGGTPGDGANSDDPGTWSSTTDAAPTSPTPEPSTFALLSTGMLGLAGIARRRFA
jgi:hypothetical protein